MKKDPTHPESLENPFQAGDVQHVFKQAKRKSVIRNILISTAASLLLIGGVFISNQTLLNNKGWKIYSEIEGLHKFAGANLHLTNAQFQYGLGQGTMRLTTYKFVEHRSVPWGEKIYEFEIMGDPSLLIGGHSDLQYIEELTTDYQVDRFSNAHNGEYEMQFYNPMIEYKKYINDLPQLDQLQENQYIEMALSLDRGYRLDEVKSMLPSQVNAVWFQVNDLTIEEAQKIEDPRPQTARSVYGFHAYRDPESRTSPNTEESFEKDLVDYMAYAKTHYKSQAERLYQSWKSQEDEGRIIGVVVTGSKEQFKSLVDKPYIKAAVLGATVDKY
ncbi:anti sigma factor C-terminal domain-containing protein [Ammoniphilus sp. CFH 90114]|uniref:anti sigma factor C-terminal domain-containing protein n=1 Tax=Ammoniphilus sp. CFH 90114 TaxID=2493665 RepID=UPI00100F74AA|nr:anti sigma factor C-terminal domain-containing protein [Ammoniphilus sp. CFH 90114]RXT07199.1 hypothetical protein EIZ39_13730 [Ammoniphilus sp. CFH 90114]